MKRNTISIGAGLIAHMDDLVSWRGHGKALIVTDTHIPAALIDMVQRSIPIPNQVVVLPAGEANKNISNVQRIWNTLHAFGCDRQSLVVTVGGGMISDLGGFAASTFMRGIDVVHIPTSLTAQVDAVIGGKTAINSAGIKNLIGSFHQPIGIIIDTTTLSSLPKREFVSGFGEILKHGLVCDHTYFDFAVSKEPLAFTAQELELIITRSCEIKSQIVAGDEKESDLRKLLNFGHTVGHALEALSMNTKIPLLHGEAILWGMRIEAEISWRSKILSESANLRIQTTLGKLSIPEISTEITISGIMKIITADKKSSKGSVRWTLLRDIGIGVINQIASEEIVAESLKGTLL